MELRGGDELGTVRGSSIGETEHPGQTFEAGRVCAFPNCGTRLSVYNSAQMCWAHEDPVQYVLRVRNGVASGTAA